MKFQYEDLMETGDNPNELINLCPYLDCELGECNRFYLDQHLMSDKPWYMPYMNILYIGGFNTLIELKSDLSNIKSWEDTKNWIKETIEKYHLKDYLVFKTCPECGLELPALDFRMREDGLCTFCGSKERQSRVTHDSRSQEVDP